MADIDTLIAELRAGLEGTTQGEWTRRDTPDYAEMIAPDQKQPLALVGRAEDANYIALASPQNVAALLDHIGRLEAHVTALQAKIDPDKSCACSFDTPDDVCAVHSPKLAAAEAELARLRAPVTDGEVGDCLAKLNNRKVNEPDFGMRLRHETADLLQRLAGQVAEAQSRFEREHSYGFVQNQLYAAEVTARDAAEDRLREAVEVMEPFAKAGAIKLCGEWKDHEYIGGTDVGFYLYFGDIRRARDFLAKLEATDADQ